MQKRTEVDSMLAAALTGVNLFVLRDPGANQSSLHKALVENWLRQKDDLVCSKFTGDPLRAAQTNAQTKSEIRPHEGLVILGWLGGWGKLICKAVLPRYCKFTKIGPIRMVSPSAKFL